MRILKSPKKGLSAVQDDMLVFLWLLLIPTQLGRHFWPDWSYVLGIRVDYLSPTLYLLDIVWLGILMLNPPLIPPLKKGGKLVWLVLMVGVNILVAENKWEAVYWWARLGQWWWMVGYLAKNKKLVWKYLLWVIPIWLILEAGLAVAQMAKGGSLQGIFYWLGERRFSFSSLGVARVAVAGVSMLRAYGTFSHPNSLAGFVLVALVLWRQVQLTPEDAKWQVRGLIKWIVNWAGIVTIILAGSRTIWSLSVLVLVYKYFSISKLKNFVSLTLVILGLFLIMLGMMSVNYRTSDFLGGWDENSFGKRWNLNMSAIRMIKDSPLLGSGLGNFLVKLPEYQEKGGFFWMQPVHNIFLLLLSELGLVGLLILGLGFNIFGKFKNLNNWVKIVLVVIVITGMVDHYWLTLVQNRWLLAVVLGLM